MSKVNVWLRKKQTVILAVLCSVLMVSWYGGSQLVHALSGSRGKQTVGTIFGRSVPAREFMALQWRLYRLSQINPMPPELVTAKAWETLLLAEEARRCGLEVTDADVRDLLQRRFPGRSGGLDSGAYNAFLDRIGLSPAEYEKLVRDLFMAALAEEMAATTIVMPKEEAWLWYSRENQTTQVRFIRLRGEDLAAICPTTEEEIRNFYQERADVPREKGGYEVPERVQIEYVMAPLARYAEEIVPTEEEIRKYYDSHQDEFKVEQPAEEKKSEKATESDSNAKPAEQPGTSGEQADPAQADSKEAAGEKGQPSGAPAKADAQSATKVKPFDEVRDEIARKLRDTEARRRAEETMRQVNEEIWKALDVPFGSEEVRTVSFQELAKKFNLLYRRPPPFSRAEALSVVPGAFKLPEKAFGQGDSAINVPRPVMDSDEGPFIFQILAIEPPHPAPYAEVAEKVTADLRRRKGFQLAQRIAEQASKASNLDEAKALVARLIREAAQSAGQTVEPETLFVTGETKFFSAPREHQDLFSGNTMRYLYDIGLEEGYNYVRFGDEAFRLNEGEVGWVAEAGIETAFVIQRMATRPADRAKFEEEYERVAPRLLDRKREAAMRTWRADLLHRAKPSKEVMESLSRLPEWQV